MKAREGLPFPDSREDAPSGSAATENKLDMPRISIVTPSFNQGEFIERTIQSVISQEYPNLEYIVMDGGSTDQTLSILTRYAEHFDYWVSAPDQGQADAINKGFGRATGEILHWLNSDDVLCPNTLFRVAEIYRDADPDVGAIVGDGEIRDSTGKLVWRPPCPEVNHDTIIHWLNGTDFMQPSCFFSRQAFDKAGGLREDLNFCLDVDLWLRIEENYRFLRIPELFSVALSHDAAKTTAEPGQCRAEFILMLLDRGEHDAASEQIYRLAAELSMSNGVYRLLKRNRLIKLLIFPFYKKRFRALNAKRDAENRRIASK